MLRVKLSGIGVCGCFLGAAVLGRTERGDRCAGTITLKEGTEMVMPGDNVTANFELMFPVAMVAGDRFAVREGGRTVAAGVVSKVL